MDLFEHTGAFYDVIVLQTVLEELRNRSLPLYNRLLALVKSDEKRFYLFFNEFRRETHVRRGPEETINDRNDRAVRMVASWYGSHLQQSAKKGKKEKAIPAIVVVTDDKENLRKCKEENVTALSLSDYVSGLEGSEMLLDMISESKDARDSKETTKESSMFLLTTTWKPPSRPQLSINLFLFWDAITVTVLLQVTLSWLKYCHRTSGKAPRLRSWTRRP
jgi:exosome complex exonuclease DIS3/RRP44